MRLPLLAGAVFAVMLCAACSEAPEPPSNVPTPGATTIVLEAEDAVAPAPFFAAVGYPETGGGRVLHCPDKVLEEGPDTPPRAVLGFEVPHDARFYVWLRARWQDSCGNSIAAVLDDAEPVIAGSDGTYGAWHWVRAGRFQLATGGHTLSLALREDGLWIDQVLLTTDAAYWPNGVAGSAAPPEIVEEPGPDPLPELEPDSPTPFRAAVGGAYRSGFEGALVRLGIPVDRLNGLELIDPQMLARYDLICLSSPDAAPSRHVPVLDEYVRNGGVLVAEFTSPFDHLAPSGNPGELLAPGDYTNRGHNLVRGCTIVPDDSPLFAGLPQNAIELAGDVGCGRLNIEPTEANAIELFGSLTVRRWRRGPQPLGAAILRRPFGKGRLYFLGAPLGFHSMWRGTAADGLLRNVLLDALGDRGRAVYADMPWQDPSGPPGLLFADDFMDHREEIGEGWHVESGEFTRLRPYRPNLRDAYSLHAAAPAVAAAVGNPEWADYRVSAAVNVRRGEAGIWLSLADGARLRLSLGGSPERLALVRLADDLETELAAAPAPAYDGWRRLSLMQRDGRVEGYLDGRLALAEPAGDLARTKGTFGIELLAGDALFDDVAVRRVDAVLPGTDRAPGEEGSCVSMSGIAPRSIEARNLYTSQWMLPPDPAGDGHIALKLPAYSPGLLLVDGEPLAAAQDGATALLIPYDRRPRQSIEFRTAGWQDYMFTSRMTDWYSLDDDWTPTPRWSCDPDWQWPGVETQRASMLWHKQQLEPPYAVCAYVGAASVRAARGGHYGRDMNIMLGGNGSDRERGLDVRVMGEMEGCELRRDGELLATKPGFGLPEGHTLHHIWWEIKALVEPDRVRFYFEGELVMDQPLDEPLAPGQFAIWTRNNAISVARVTISTADPAAR